MAVLTAQGISSVAIELLIRQLVLPRTVTALPGGEFAGSNGDTITVRVPQPGSARTQASPGASITYDDVDEIPVNVSLSHLYHAKRVSDEELSLDIEGFARQVTRVQVAAVATGAEDQLATAMNDLSADESFAASEDTDDTMDKVYAAREFLGGNDVPPGDRYLAVSPQIATRILKVLVNRETPDTDGALRQAMLGSLAGFTVVESNALDTGTAVAYHRSGFAFANRTPVEPRGATDSSTATSQGVGLRHIFQYQPDVLSDASVVSTFAGAAAVVDSDDTAPDVKRFYKLDTAA